MLNPFGSRLLLLGAFSFAGASLLAQTARPSSALMLSQPLSRNCPVILHADRLPGGDVARAADAGHPESQPLRIAFTPTQPHGIQQAEVILHGLSGSQVLPAGSPAGTTATETVLVKPTVAAKHRSETIVSPKKLTAVLSLELTSITFADGAVWHPSADSTCRVAPDGYLLVAGEK